jgi:hypothetical protein
VGSVDGLRRFLASTRIAEDRDGPDDGEGVARSVSEDGLKDFSIVRPRRARNPSIPAEKVEEIVRLTLYATLVGKTQWCCRTMARPC